jgi:ribonuclease R
MRIDTPDHISQSLNKLLADVKGKPEQRILETLAIRSMAKAAYSTRADIGHYGLAFKDYAHFTSPIRRYPDVMLHRILEQCLNNHPQYGHIDELERRCEHTSLMERKAMQAERESTKYKQVEYMSERLGQVFDGVISGVVNFGFFVEMKDNKCEGLVPIDTLIDDNYDYDQMQHAIVGSRRGKRYQLGSPVRVRVVKTDLVTRTMNLEVAK